MRLNDFWIIGVFFIGVFVGIIFLFNVYFVSESASERCVDVNRAAGFIYDVCFDSNSGNIFMLVDGEEYDFDFDSFNVTFYDSEFRKYRLFYEDVNVSQLYKFAAKSNPGFVNLTLNVEGVFEFPVCEVPRQLAIRDCLGRFPGRGEGSLNGSVVDESFSVRDPTKYNVSFVEFDEREAVWANFCKSEWGCSDWEECIDGLQRRSCIDLNRCVVSINVVETVRACEDKCSESWVCDWSECVDGFTTPNCFDENDCGTSFIIPSKVRCFFEEGCYPLIRCGEWTDCNINYNLYDLLNGGIEDFAGVRTRVCRDLNNCVEPSVETKACSSGVDVYTSRFEEDGDVFIGIFDSLDNSLIAKINEGSEEDPHLNIYLN